MGLDASSEIKKHPTSRVVEHVDAFPLLLDRAGMLHLYSAGGARWRKTRVDYLPVHRRRDPNRRRECEPEQRPRQIKTDVFHFGNSLAAGIGQPMLL
jgi:hypothetical protein